MKLLVCDRMFLVTNDYIINWLKENTTFKHFINLGQDDDCIPPFEKYYNSL